MCKSVPQIEAAFTRTSTSPCPTSGTGTLSIRNPRAASTFRSAFIVAAIPASSSLLHQLLNAQSQILAYAPASFIRPRTQNGPATISPRKFHEGCHPEGIRRGCPKDLNVNLAAHSTRRQLLPIRFPPPAPHFASSTTPISSNAFKYSTTNSNGTGPYS